MEIDTKFLSDAKSIHSTHAHYTSDKAMGFIVRHYAGNVSYQAGLLGDTNKDSLKLDLVKLMKTSKLAMVSTSLYGNADEGDESLKSTITASTRIRTQCQELVDTLMECQPHYIRCIKSNETKSALTMDKERVLHQIKYLGLSENIKVRRAGYVYRCDYHRYIPYTSTYHYIQYMSYICVISRQISRPLPVPLQGHLPHLDRHRRVRLSQPPQCCQIKHPQLIFGW